jgi:hypothetical protein
MQREMARQAEAEREKRAHPALVPQHSERPSNLVRRPTGSNAERELRSD